MLYIIIHIQVQYKKKTIKFYMHENDKPLDLFKMYKQTKISIELLTVHYLYKIYMDYPLFYNID